MEYVCDQKDVQDKNAIDDFETNEKLAIAAYRKKYYKVNKEKLAEKRKKYYEANKEKIAEKRKKDNEAKKSKL